MRKDESIKPSSHHTSAKFLARRQAFRFIKWVVAVLFVAIAALAAITKFDYLGVNFHVNFALILGVAATILLAAGLMALTIYSNLSGVDEHIINFDDQSPGDADDQG